MVPGQQASAEGMVVEGAEDEGEADLAATFSVEAAGVVDTAATTRATDAVAADSTASATIVTRADICGAIATSSLMDGLLLKAKRLEEQEEGEEEAVEAVAVVEVVLQEPAAVGKVTLHSQDYWVIDSGATYSMTPRADLLTELEPSPMKHVTSALGQRAEVKGMGKAMFNHWKGCRRPRSCGSRKIPGRLRTHLCFFLTGPFASRELSESNGRENKGWLLWDPFTKKFLVSRDCKFMENLMYKDWKAENEAKIGMRFGEVKGSGLEHVELPLELSSGSTTTRQYSLVNGGEEAKDAEEEEEEVQQVSERAPTLPSRTTSAPRIRVNLKQRQGLHVPAAEEEGRGKRRIQAPNRLTYEALGKPAKSALVGAALIVGDDEESDYEECAFAFFSPVEMPGEPATLKEALESSDAEEWKKAMESELKSIEENGTWELVELPEGRKVITSKWLFKIKSDADGKIERYKSRLQRQGLHVPAAEEEGRGKRRIQAPNRLTYEALGKPAKSALVGAALIVGDDEESDYEECAFAFFSPVEMPGEPATLKEALESSDAEEWKKTMESELKSIEENGTWELVELPEGRKVITSKWLFKIKSDADGKIERYKSRLPKTLRTLLAGAAIKEWVVKQMDVTTAFLNGVLEEEIFMAQPEGFDDCSGRVLRLKKALYRLKQAPRLWYLKLRGVLEEISFTPSSADHSLFMLGEGEQRSFMVVYVDDILIFSPSSDLVKKVMLKLQDKFKCKALGNVNFYLGLHTERDVEKRCVRVHQRKYLEALAANFGQNEGHVATTFPSGFKCVKGPEEESVGEEERRRFHSLVGSLMYAAVNTRPDVAFATRQLARVVQCPSEEQVAAGMRVAKYLGQTPTVGLQYSAAAQRRQKGADGVEPERLFLTAFSDASYASEPEDMTSVGGFICCVGGGPTAWESKKQVDQALSSVESEYMAIFRAVREIVWQRRLLAELGEDQQGPTPLYCDSQGAIALAKNPVLHGLTKHMRVKWHWTRSMVATGEVELHYVKTTSQPADMMTKRLVEQQHWKCCKLAGMALN
ncbi:unnamed protein product [Closterium sp. NIES-53]